MYAATEQKIIDRLRAVLGPSIPVHSLAELEEVPQLRQKAPAVFVIYDGYSVGDKIGAGQVQAVVQDWYVVAAAKNANRGGNPTAARDQAATIAETALGALIGYHLGGGAYLNLADAPGPEYDGGFAYLPLAFTTRATFKASPT